MATKDWARNHLEEGMGRGYGDEIIFSNDKKEQTLVLVQYEDGKYQNGWYIILMEYGDNYEEGVYLNDIRNETLAMKFAKTYMKKH